MHCMAMAQHKKRGLLQKAALWPYGFVALGLSRTLHIFAMASNA